MDIVTITEQHTDTVDLRGYPGDVRLVLPPDATVTTIYGPLWGNVHVVGGTVKRLGPLGLLDGCTHERVR